MIFCSQCGTYYDTTAHSCAASGYFPVKTREQSFAEQLAAARSAGFAEAVEQMIASCEVVRDTLASCRAFSPDRADAGVEACEGMLKALRALAPKEPS